MRPSRVALPRTDVAIVEKVSLCGRGDASVARGGANAGEGSVGGWLGECGGRRGREGGRREGKKTDIGVDEALVLGLVVDVDGHGAEGGDFGREG